MKEKTACFSGHRPEKLPEGGDERSPLIGEIKSMLHLQIYEAIERGYTRFLSGMAKGVDIWAAEMVLELAVSHPQVELICAVPYKGHGRSLYGENRYRYRSIIDSAAEVIELAPRYTPDCLRKRNAYMVEQSSLLIAVCADAHSGTGQTIRLARKNGLQTRVIRLQDVQA